MKPATPSGVIPCRSPKVLLNDLSDPTTALCRTGTCTWSFTSVVRREVETAARVHRADHRMAVPAHSIGNSIQQGGRTCQCSCGWALQRATATDAQASMTHHLSSVHGLVTS